MYQQMQGLNTEEKAKSVKCDVDHELLKKGATLMNSKQLCQI
jgi:hypothetical protein